jgi:hypothetical protein
MSQHLRPKGRGRLPDLPPAGVDTPRGDAYFLTMALVARTTMKRRVWGAVVSALVLAGCSSEGRLTTKMDVAQILAEMTYTAYQALLVSAMARSGESQISVDCPEGGSTRVARTPDAQGRSSFTFVLCNDGRNRFDGSISARLTTDSNMTALTYSGQLTSAGKSNGTLRFDDFLQKVIFPPGDDARLFTMTLTGKMLTIDSRGERTWTFDSQSYGYDRANALTSPL